MPDHLYFSKTYMPAKPVAAGTFWDNSNGFFDDLPPAMTAQNIKHSRKIKKRLIAKQAPKVDVKEASDISFKINFDSPTKEHFP